MPWFKVDDALAFHMKAIGAGNGALGLWVRAGSWSMHQLTDGFIPVAIVAALGGNSDDAKALVSSGLWHPADGGYQFHDWAEYQPTREQVLAERAAATERKRVSREKSRQKSQAESHRDARGTDAVIPASPSRPVPTLTSTKTSESQSRDTRANVSTDAIQISAMTKRLAAQKGIKSLRGVVDAIVRYTGIHATADEAFQLSVHLLDKAKEWPDAPQRYVTACIKQSPAEVSKHLYEEIGVAS